MTKAKDALLDIEVALAKEKSLLTKYSVNLESAIGQRKNLKNKAKIVSLLEYKEIVKEIIDNKKKTAETSKRIAELLIKYEQNKKNQKS